MGMQFKALGYQAQVPGFTLYVEPKDSSEHGVHIRLDDGVSDEYETKSLSYGLREAEELGNALIEAARLGRALAEQMGTTGQNAEGK